jgi:hypothetical protein
MITERNNMFKFDNKISIDGIAILLAMLGAAIWIGTLSQRVNQLEANDSKQQASIDRLAQTQNETSQVLAKISGEVERRNQ